MARRRLPPVTRADRLELAGRITATAAALSALAAELRSRDSLQPGPYRRAALGFRLAAPRLDSFADRLGPDRLAAVPDPGKDT